MEGEEPRIGDGGKTRVNEWENEEEPDGGVPGANVKEVPFGDLDSASLDERQAVSALRDNIARKGKNSYYYAHNRVMDAPLWDGQQAPRLLTAGDSPALNTPRKKAKRVENITNYAWSNEKTKVKIYVPVEGVEKLDDELVSLRWEPKSMDLELEMKDCTRRLIIPSLHDEISDAILRKKQGKVVIVLTKKDEVTWYDLTGR